MAYIISNAATLLSWAGFRDNAGEPIGARPIIGPDTEGYTLMISIMQLHPLTYRDNDNYDTNTLRVQPYN